MKQETKQKTTKKWNIEFKAMGVTYPNGKEALKNINLNIKEGEYVSIIGLSGAGKTTLLKTMNLINPITSGNIFIGDKKLGDFYELKKLRGKELRKYRTHIGMVFQRYNLIYNTTVLNNVLSTLMPKLPWYRASISLFTKKEKNIAFKALSQVNILETSYVRAKDLSGGQMQRVALARTIAQDARIILADEPVGALDPIMAKSVMDSFHYINKKQERTVIMNLHHVELALEYTDRVIGVKEGKVVFDGHAEKVNLNVLKKIYGNELSGFGAHELKEVWRKRKITQNNLKKILENEKKKKNDSKNLKKIAKLGKAIVKKQIKSKKKKKAVK